MSAGSRVRRAYTLNAGLHGLTVFRRGKAGTQARRVRVCRPRPFSRQRASALRPPSSAVRATGSGMIFGAFERMVAFRYLRARRQEGFVSVIAIFSLLGIALGVATLIIVMSVMNGFRAELLGRILGLNGHLGGLCARRPARRFRRGRRQGARRCRGSSASTPMVEGQVMATSRSGAAGRAGARHPARGHPRAAR